jgi:hypothetical protein
MGHGFWADVIVAFHTAYVAFIVVGLVAICVGALLRWGWVRNPWFRYTHLIAIVIVAGEAVLGLSIEHPRRREERSRGWEFKAERAGRRVQNFGEEIGQER